MEVAKKQVIWLDQAHDLRLEVTHYEGGFDPSVTLMWGEKFVAFIDTYYMKVEHCLAENRKQHVNIVIDDPRIGDEQPDDPVGFVRVFQDHIEVERDTFVPDDVWVVRD